MSLNYQRHWVLCFLFSFANDKFCEAHTTLKVDTHAKVNFCVAINITTVLNDRTHICICITTITNNSNTTNLDKSRQFKKNVIWDEQVSFIHSKADEEERHLKFYKTKNKKSSQNRKSVNLYRKWYRIYLFFTLVG